MMHTEQEAREHYCPFLPMALGTYGPTMMHVPDPFSGGSSGFAAPMRQYTCQASNCMMWRAAETKEFARQADEAFRKDGTRLISDTGYCGLAGSPT